MDVEKQTDRGVGGGLWVTITDVISRGLIEHNRLNWRSLSGLLPEWGINPSTSLKCTVTDSGKLPSAGLFACLLRRPHLPCGESTYQRNKKSSAVSSPVTVDTTVFYKRAKQKVWRHFEDPVFHEEPWKSKTKPGDLAYSEQLLHLNRGGINHHAFPLSSDIQLGFFFFPRSESELLHSGLCLGGFR